MKKIYVVPTVEAYTVDHTDVIATSGDPVTVLDNGDIGIRGSALFGD